MNLLDRLQDAESRLYMAQMIDEPSRRSTEISRYSGIIASIKPQIDLTNRFYAYDIETYQNLFCVVVKHILSGHRWIFEISDWKNDGPALVAFLYMLKSHDCYLVGFNNLGFDYPVVHHCVKIFQELGYMLASDAKQKQIAIFASQEDSRFANIIWDRDQIVKQVDLYKIHHFDNKAKITDLKSLEVNMRADNIGELPYDPDQPLTREQVWHVITYCCHDVDETIRFFNHSFDKIRFRKELSVKLNTDFMNHNDTKIGKDYFIMRLEETDPNICFSRERGSRKQPRQTYRKTIPVRDIILPYVRFGEPELNRILEHLKTLDIPGDETKSPPGMEGLSANIRGFSFDFGAGGLHGSIKKTSVYSDSEYVIKDVDVTSFYPALAIKNRVFPMHLSSKFCDIYSDLFDERAIYPKKTAENEMLKLSLNGVYGDSNNVHGPFLDPQYTMTITINGQLSIAMLAESLLSLMGIEMIQANTDGITVKMHRSCEPIFDRMCKEWEVVTGLSLEYADYQAMHVRDVNSYIAVTTEGKVKRIGCYAYETAAENGATRELAWHKDWSARVVPKAAEAYFLKGISPADFIYGHTDPYDFIIRAKVDRKTQLVTTLDGIDTPTNRISRYIIANKGPSLFKIMRPLAKAPEKWRRMGMSAGWKIRLCNNITDYDWSILNRSFYIEEVEKIIWKDK